jgi:hypothetical protein
VRVRRDPRLEVTTAATRVTLNLSNLGEFPLTMAEHSRQARNPGLETSGSAYEFPEGQSN